MLFHNAPKKVLVFGGGSVKTSRCLCDASFKLGEAIAESNNILVRRRKFTIFIVSFITHNLGVWWWKNRMHGSCSRWLSFKRWPIYWCYSRNILTHWRSCYRFQWLHRLNYGLVQRVIRF